jgi:hypothetical protein
MKYAAGLHKSFVVFSGCVMGESHHHRLGHFAGTDLCRKLPATVRLDLEEVQYRAPPLLRYTFSWKHLQDPADFGRLEEFNEAILRLESDHHHRMDNSAASHGDGRKRKAGKICHDEAPAAAPEKVGQVASFVVVMDGGLEKKLRA